MSTDHGQGLPPGARPAYGVAIGYAVLTVAALAWSLSGIEVSPERIMRGFGQAGHLLTMMFLQPDWSYVAKEDGLLEGLRQSVQIAALGTAIAAVLAIPFGVLAARNLYPLPIAPLIGKQLLNLIRTFPELLLAIAFIKGIGPGAFAGVLAIGIHSIGMMGKLYAERIETTDKGALESLRAAGASPLEVFVFGIVPEVLPDFLSFTLYRFDLNIRSATVLGIVGAGGIGEKLVFQQMSSNWHTIGVIVMGIIVTILLVDFISGKLRAKLA
ncbi:MAG: phosphonate ABC transporter, permease protein PhnE [Capsulimonadales bacterium]|nr:phosphonate ABC transporter, permease protein PhnE [Capsulimonadales bacterium]